MKNVPSGASEGNPRSNSSKKNPGRIPGLNPQRKSSEGMLLQTPRKILGGNPHTSFWGITLEKSLEEIPWCKSPEKFLKISPNKFS